jgi:hypothetical protein
MTRHRALRARRRRVGQAPQPRGRGSANRSQGHRGRAVLVRSTPRSCQCHPRIRPDQNNAAVGILEPPIARLLRTIRHLLRALLLTFLVIEKSKSPQDPAKRARAKSQLTCRGRHSDRCREPSIHGREQQPHTLPSGEKVPDLRFAPSGTTVPGAGCRKRHRARGAATHHPHRMPNEKTKKRNNQRNQTHRHARIGALSPEGGAPCAR